MGKAGAFFVTFMAIGLAGLAQAVPTNTDITGELSKAENTCVSPIAIFTNNPPQLCSYSGGEDVAIAVGLGAFKNWMGPLDSGGFYATGTGPDPLTTDGSMPGDGKANLPITGTITIEDNNTPGAGNGGDDSISGTLVIGAGERSVSTSDGTATESFDSVTHVIPVRVVDFATDNALGGYDYVIGTAGFPLLLHSGFGMDDYPSEVASEASGSSSPPDFNVWDQANGGNVPVVNPFPVGNPFTPAEGPYTVEIVTYAPVNGNVGPNIGVATNAIAAAYTCLAGDGMGNVLDDCSTDPDVGSPGTWQLAGAEFDNLILKLSTNAAGKLVSADAFYTIEYKIPSLFPNGGAKPGSYIGGTLTLVAVTGAEDDNAKTLPGTSVDIDILANDTGFIDPVTVSLPAMGGTDQGGSVTINGFNPGSQAGINVTYGPPAMFEGQDHFEYVVDDSVSTALVSVNITVSTVLAPNAGINTGEQQPIDVVVASLPGVSLGQPPVTISVVSGPSSGTATVVGQTITYTPEGIAPTDMPPIFKFPAADAFDYQIQDSLGKSDTGTIDVSIGPSLVPVAADDTADVKQDSSVNIAVTANDTAGSGDISDHTVTVTFEPLNGTAVVEADNTITYTPNPGVSGVALFQYALADTGSTQAELDINNNEIGPKPDVDGATVTITVENVPVDISLPSGQSSATGPLSLLLLVVIAWLRRRTRAISPMSPERAWGG